MNSILVCALLANSSVTLSAQSDVHDQPGNEWCVELNQAAVALAASGHVAQAEDLLRTGHSGDEVGMAACRGHVLSNMAAKIAVLGHIEEAERLAGEAVRILESSYGPTDQVLLRPLQVLAAVRIESGKTARAREDIKRMQSIPRQQLEDDAIVHATSGALLQVEGRREEAEAEYRDAFRAIEAEGRSESADAGAILHCLAALYIEEERLEQAGRIIDRALEIYSRAKDTVPMDYVKFLDLRGVMHARAGEWRQAEEDLGEALRIADRQLVVGPGLLRMLLNNYSSVLRKNHHGREASHIESRAALLPIDRTAPAIVDLSNLRASKKAVQSRPKK